MFIIKNTRLKIVLKDNFVNSMCSKICVILSKILPAMLVNAAILCYHKILLNIFLYIIMSL